MDISEILENKLMKIGGCGFGCVLTKLEVLKKIGYPQFKYHDPRGDSYGCSEDIDFAIKARDNKIDIFTDTSIKCEHISTIKLLV